MNSKFTASAIANTRMATDTGRLEVTLSDERGQLQTLTITSAIATALSEVFANFSVASHSDEAAATKMPKEFAVGIGRHERVVLIRFEDDIPYGLEISQAVQLGRVLVEQAEIISSRPLPLRQ